MIMFPFYLRQFVAKVHSQNLYEKGMGGEEPPHLERRGAWLPKDYMNDSLAMYIF